VNSLGEEAGRRGAGCEGEPMKGKNIKFSDQQESLEETSFVQSASFPGADSLEEGRYDRAAHERAEACGTCACNL